MNHTSKKQKWYDFILAAGGKKHHWKKMWKSDSAHCCYYHRKQREKWVVYEVGYRVESQGFGNMISCGNSDVMMVCLSQSYVRTHTLTHTYTHTHTLSVSTFLRRSANVINIVVNVICADCIVFKDVSPPQSLAPSDPFNQNLLIAPEIFYFNFYQIS